jgi:hypothetical protein
VQSKTNRVIRVAAIAAALGLTALQVSAQQGTFNLPVEAHWGRAVLEPGQHRVSIPTATGQKLVYLQGNKTTQMSIPLTTQPSQENRSYIHLVKINGAYYVDAYQSEFSGSKYFFSKPKPNRTAGPAVDEESTIISVASR